MEDIVVVGDLTMVRDRRRMYTEKFPDICLTVQGKPRKNLNEEIDPTGDRTRAR